MVRVYSTEDFKHCKAQSSSSRGPMRSSPERPAGIIYLERQTKGRRGKPVVIIRGLPLNKLDLEETARKFKTKCGVGGAVIRDTILIQGDKRALLKEELETMGYEVKLTGG